MQFTTLALALGLTSAAMGAAIQNVTPGINIRQKGAPVATSLSITQEVSEVGKREVEKRDSGHLFVCTDDHFKGTCQNLQFTGGLCTNLFSPFQDSISSAGPDNGWSCQVFADRDCFGTWIRFTNPGIQDFNVISPNINDQISSYLCVRG